ncbi:MAG: DNA-binding beta-propeller fold protein YncE [Bacteroidia bacterium]
MAWDGNDLWHNDTEGPFGYEPNDSTFKINTSGDVLQRYQAIGGCPSGLAFDGQYLWSSENINDEIHKIDVSTFLVIETIAAPGDYPNGLAFDGQYLWVSDNGTDSIYQIDIGFTPTGVHDVTPMLNEPTIYPNPSIGIFTINVPDQTNIQASVFDALVSLLQPLTRQELLTLTLVKYQRVSIHLGWILNQER